MRALLLLALSGAPSVFAQDTAAKLFTDYYEWQLKNSPELATSLGRSEYNHLWSDNSPAGAAEERRAVEMFRKRAAAMPVAGLSEQDRVSLELLQYSLGQSLEGFELQTYLFPVNQLFGLHTGVIATLTDMPARTGRDYENIVARLRAIPKYIDGSIALLEQAIERKLVQPKLVAELMAQQVAAQMSTPAAAAPMLAAFKRFPDNVAEADRERLTKEAFSAYEQQFQPAWRKLHKFLTEVYEPAARETTAAAALPNGEKHYSFLVRMRTTTALSPKEIHELGLREVRRIEAEMDRIARSTGFAGSLSEFEQKLSTSPDNLFRTKDEMLIYCRNVAMIADPELPRLFKRLPRMPFGIRAIPEDREAQTASNYSPAAADGTRAGWFNLNAYRPDRQVKHTKDALTLHEGVPGHHLQIALQREIEGLPEFRKIYRVTAYSEGWGLYAESLGPELGLYKDPLTLLGRYSSERFRAVRLVVDTGLHALGWTRQQAIDYFKTHAPTSSLAEIDRYIANPGQALAYKMGELKITELRRRAEKQLGARFDIREFHDVVLRNGAMPLELVERQVNAWIAGQLK